MTDDAALDELRFLTRALRAHLEWQAATGTTGLERATREAAPGPAPVAVSAIAEPPRPLASVSAAAVVVPAPHLSTSASDEPRRLEVLAELVRTCTRCGLCKQRTQ